MKAGKPSSDAEHPDYVPSIFASMKNKGSSSSVNRYNRQVKRREVWNAPLTEIENEPPILKLDTKEVDCQTDLTFQEISEMEQKLHALETNFVNITHKHSQNEIFTNAKAFNFYTKIQNVTFFTAHKKLTLNRKFRWDPLNVVVYKLELVHRRNFRSLVLIFKRSKLF
ncbi:hypothetical protein TNCV_833771 [Trichonephila clavipes]|nr:hypothetical protein TNCV_833771 [Trichonephila clavipes]